MSTIREEFVRIHQQLDDCFVAVSEKGVQPATEHTLVNLAANIRSISQTSGGEDVVIVEGNQITVPLGNGIYNNESNIINWWAGNGAILIMQSKGSGTTVVNQTFISAPRLYKGHYMAFTCRTGVIDEIEIKYSGQYKGYNIKLGTTVDNSGNVVEYSGDDLTIELDTMTDGTHIIKSKGLETIVLQNVSDSSNVQLRITDIHITYHANEN